MSIDKRSGAKELIEESDIIVSVPLDSPDSSLEEAEKLVIKQVHALFQRLKNMSSDKRQSVAKVLSNATPKRRAELRVSLETRNETFMPLLGQEDIEKANAVIEEMMGVTVEHIVNNHIMSHARLSCLQVLAANIGQPVSKSNLAALTGFDKESRAIANFTRKIPDVQGFELREWKDDQQIKFFQLDRI